jgi:hypothetical protein
MDGTIRLPNDQRRQRGRQAPESFTGSDFFPQFFSSNFENWQSSFATPLASGRVASTFGGPLSRENDDRLDAGRLLSEHGIDPASSTIRRKKKPRAEAS